MFRGINIFVALRGYAAVHCRISGATGLVIFHLRCWCYVSGAGVSALREGPVFCTDEYPAEPGCDQETDELEW